MKANLEVLLTKRPPAAEDRDELTRDLIEQIDELTLLVDDVVELARKGEPERRLSDVGLDEMVRLDAVERMRPHACGIRFECDIDGPVRRAGGAGATRSGDLQPARQRRQVECRGGRVEVRLRDGTLEVRDHGPGINPEDLPLVFDRFYRAPGGAWDEAAPAWAWRSCARSRRPTARRLRRTTRRAGCWSGSGSRPPTSSTCA